MKHLPLSILIQRRIVFLSFYSLSLFRFVSPLSLPTPISLSSPPSLIVFLSLSSFNISPQSTFIFLYHLPILPVLAFIYLQHSSPFIIFLFFCFPFRLTIHCNFPVFAFSFSLPLSFPILPFFFPFLPHLHYSLFLFSSFTTLPFFCLCFPLSLYQPLPRLSLVFLNLILFLFFPHYSSPPKNYLHFPFLLILCFSLQFKGNESRDLLSNSVCILQS